MARKILLRILQIFPTLIIISLILFFLSRSTPSDPVEKMMGLSSFTDQTISPELYERKYNQLAQTLGLDKPLFYFSLTPRSYPDTLWQMDKFNRADYLKMIHKYPNERLVNKYFHEVGKLDRSIGPILDDLSSRKKIGAYQQLLSLKRETGVTKIRSSLLDLSETLEAYQSDTLLSELQKITKELSLSKERFYFFPRFRWFGFDNQYHHWIKNILGFDFGISIRDGRPVSKKIRESILWTLALNGTALFLAFIISIALGTFLGGMASRFWDETISAITYAVYAIPIFWLATLCIVFLTTPEYGEWTDLFPSVGITQSYSGASFGSRLMASLPRLVLPLLLLIAAMMSYLTRQMRSSIKEELRKPYIQVLKIKGITRMKRLWKHALPNSLFPMITLFGFLIPFIFAGSLVIEYIFNIPGMGLLLMNSILFEDWNVAFTIVFLISIVTMLGLLFADVLYAWIDPRVKLGD